jgi:hypothetical protein
MMRRHPQSRGEKLFKNNSLVEIWLRNNFFPRLTRRTFGEITQGLNLTDAAHCDQRSSELIAPHEFVWIHGSLSFSFDNIAAPDDEASNEELAVEVSGKGPFGASPTMSMTSEPSPSITKANRSRSFKQVHGGSEGELARANVGAVSK